MLYKIRDPWDLSLYDIVIPTDKTDVSSIVSLIATILFQTIETTPERIECFISQHAGDFLNILKGTVKFDVNTKEFNIHLPNKIVFVNQ